MTKQQQRAYGQVRADALSGTRNREHAYRDYARRLYRELSLAQSRLAEVEKDAARYWAKKHIDCLKFMETKGYKTCKDTDSLIIAWNLSYDAAIDEAIKRSSATADAEGRKG